MYADEKAIYNDELKQYSDVSHDKKVSKLVQVLLT